MTFFVGMTGSMLLLSALAGGDRSTSAVDVSKLPPADSRPIDFVRDVQPILVAHCHRCHGPERQESSYRLDVKETALTGGDGSAPNIVPNKSSDSPIIHYVAGVVADMRMPPEGQPLMREQVAVLRAWIDQGARWPDSASAKAVDKTDLWSLKPLVAGVAPKPTPTDAGEIDSFVQSSLAERGWRSSPLADRRTLLRRVTFDLLGLPPSPPDVDAFVADALPDAFERVVDRLLASPRYGERWARHWMDAVHFAETHGHDQDRIRENAWPYRDYLIASFNADKPYDRFLQEQVAGDALFPNNPEATVALGFLAAGPWDESSLRDIREDTIDREIGRYLDRDDVVSNVMNNFTGMTVQCARCHDHKFDPITQADYYSLQAVFAGVERANRAFDADPAIHVKRQQLHARSRAIDRLEPATRAWLLGPDVAREVAEWEKSSRGATTLWSVATPTSATSADGATLQIQEDGSVLASSHRPEVDTYTMTIAPGLSEVAALRLEALADDRLPMHGPGRQDNGNFHLSEVEVHLGSAAGERLPIRRAWATFNQMDWEVGKAIDGNPDTAWGIHPQIGRTQTAVFEFERKTSIAMGTTITVVLKQLHGRGHLIGRPRLAVTGQAVGSQPFGPDTKIADILAVAPEHRSQEQRVALAGYFLREKISHELAELPKPSFVYAAASDFEPDGGLKPPPGPRLVRVLRRGDIRQPMGNATPGALGCISSIPSRFEVGNTDDESMRRAMLAKWLLDPANPLAWRSIVNRVWQHHFGRGLAATPNDFGHMGSPPTHPELLDWLAADFRDDGRLLKRLHRQIVTSATYRQTSHAPPVEADSAAGEAAKHEDADNRFLWRMNRLRLDAECVRDAVLCVSNRLDLRMGGPSDRQFDLKPGRHVTPLIDYSKFDLDGPGGRRRSVYRFLFRTLPDPFMESLDCPAGDQMTPTRTNSVTVQQALALWNDAFMIRQCELFAERLQSLDTSVEGQVAEAFRLALSREPAHSESLDFSKYARKHGLANFCRVLLNTNEFVYVD